LRQRLDRCADDWLRECASRENSASLAAARPAAAGRAVPWLVAAASLVVTVAGGWSMVMKPEATWTTATLGQWRAQWARERMLASAPLVARWNVAGLEEAGDVLWDNTRQRGFLRLRGFVPNEPERAQYQLWIFDAARDERYPVDGGVFDVPAGRAEVIVPVASAVRVTRPEAFAVTVERPGGAVVSDRAKLVAYARPGG
jgi:anti-sigma-K factor RskA